VEEIEYERLRSVEEEHWWYVSLHALILDFVCGESERLGRSLKILDAGCGTGRLCQLLAPIGEVHGCDIHHLAVELATRRGISNVVLLDLSDRRIGEDSYDVITMMDVLYHRRLTSELAVLRNLHKALREGGILMMQVPAFEILRGSHDVAVHTRRRYRRRQVVRMLEGCGFRIELATYRLAGMFLPLLAWRLGSRILSSSQSAPPASDVARLPPRFINRVLAGLLSLENRFVLRGKRLPVGTSVFVFARK
jgi:SAM-dependent methyltransferase